MPNYFNGETSSHGASSHNLSTISKTHECSRRSPIPFFLNLSPLPSLSKFPTNRDELQSTMNATIVTICNLLQTLLPQSKVIATIELLQMQTLHSNQMLQLQQHDYTIMHYCKTPLLQSNVKAMHCHKTLTCSSQIKICSIYPKINLKKANGKELACQETL
jgi:hypothetical protein